MEFLDSSYSSDFAGIPVIFHPTGLNMRIFEIVFWNGQTQIVFAKTRREIRKKFIGIREINIVCIDNVEIF